MIGKINVGGAGAHTHSVSEIGGGDNLYNKDSAENGIGWINADGTIDTTETNFKVSHKINAQSKVAYTASCDKNTILYAMAYDNNDNALWDGTYSGGGGFFFIAPENTSYIRFCIRDYTSANESNISFREAFLYEQYDYIDYQMNYLHSLASSKANKNHTHAISEVTNLQTALDGKASATDVANLQTALDGKASATDVANLQTAINGKADSTHGHAISEITNLQTVLDGKASTSDIENLQMSIKTFTSLEEIGLTVGSETIYTIAEAMPDYSVLLTYTGIRNNSAILPGSYGVLEVTKTDGYYTVFRFTEYYDDEVSHYMGMYDSGDWTGWTLINGGDESFTYGTADLTAGSSPLETGKVYFVYE